MRLVSPTRDWDLSHPNLDRRVLNTCLYQGFRADPADREKGEIP
jgi:hypothetical protein